MFLYSFFIIIKGIYLYLKNFNAQKQKEGYKKITCNPHSDKPYQ